MKPKGLGRGLDALLGAEEAPGVKEGGVLEQVTRELTIEALPTEIPDSIQAVWNEPPVGLAAKSRLSHVPRTVPVATLPSLAATVISP